MQRSYSSLLLILSICACLVTTSNLSLAETTSGSSEEQSYYQTDNSSFQDEEAYDVALAPIIGVVIGVFARAAIQITKRQIQKGFSEQAAKTAVSAIKAGRIRKMNIGCYAVEAAGRSRVILAPDKKTVLFAGSHEAYSKIIKQDSMLKACKKKVLVGSNTTIERIFF